MFVYQVIIYLLGLGFRIGSLFNQKIRAIAKGRKQAWQYLEQSNIDHSKRMIWFHVASLGEFEQVRPLIDECFDGNKYTVALSFSSSSGYEIRNQYPKIHHCFYLPLDTKKNAHKLLDQLKPDIIIWVKYDFWFNVLKEAFHRKIPTYLVCGSFRPEQYFFKTYAQSFLNVLKKFDKIYTINNSSFDLLKAKQFQNIIRSGDLRIESVIRRKAGNEKIDFLENQSKDRKVIVLGSTHQSDIEVIKHFIDRQKDELILLVPHEIKGAHINSLKNTLKEKATCWTDLTDVTAATSSLFIVDTVGILFHIYQYADVVYIGGGFEKGIHNTLEPAVFHKPIIFGPHYQKFDEARFFTSNEMAFSISNPSELIDTLERLNNSEEYNRICLAYAEYFQTQENYTKNIYHDINKISG